MNKKIIYLLTYTILASIIVYLTKPVYLLSIIIVLVPPAITNFLWLKKSRRKILLFSFSATFLFSFAVELIGRLNNMWDVQSVFPRILKIMPVENILFAFINFLWVLSFYEYFVDKDASKKTSKKFKYLTGIFILFSVLIFTIYFYNPNLIKMNYLTIASIILLMPSILIFSKNPKLLKKTIKPVIFFSVIFFIYEAVSLLIGSWWWPGEYLLPINFLKKTFPLDDIIIWYVLSTVTLIGGYEFFMDDFK
jgi:hypothetical protein